MKISLAWVFDHIQGTVHEHDWHEIVTRLQETTAEIDGVQELSIAWEHVYVAQVTRVADETVQTVIAEAGTNALLPSRPDAVGGGYYLVKKINGSYAWTTLRDLGGDKEGLVPALHGSAEWAAGTWRLGCEARDLLLDIDNKSLTNRPDLWGHRGFAREIAALFGLQLRPEDELIACMPVAHFAQTASRAGSIGVDITQSNACSRFAGVTLHNVGAGASTLRMASRLVRVGVRPMQWLVDATNYVMYDWGQPLHVYDAQKITGDALAVRQARDGELLALLDGTSVVLSTRDCVVADATQALGLAGVMGGVTSSVTRATKQVFVESAHFDAATIRCTAARLKKRTESSARFEKTLDPNQNTVALMRYLRLLAIDYPEYRAEETILSVGALVPDHDILVSHKFLVDRLGLALTQSQVMTILLRLGFGVREREGADGLGYQVTVPSFRSSKDVRLKEDILEEVARFYGYRMITPVLPTRSMRPFSYEIVERRRALKNHCAYAGGMREVATYPLFDESFLREIGYEPQETARVVHPVSENFVRLVTSLVPHLVKCVVQNGVHHEQQRFFELARVWRLDNGALAEQGSCAGIMFERKNPVDFYACKHILQTLFELFGLLVQWQPASGPLAPLHAPWYDAPKTAALVCDGVCIGYAGMMDPAWLSRAVPGAAFVWEIDAGLLLGMKRPARAYLPLSRYQEVVLDVSTLMACSVPVTAIEEAIALADARVRDVVLVDTFTKDEWLDSRSVAFRYVVQDDDRTLTKADIDLVQQSVHEAIQALGGQIR
jgi:phenylalanyl-tRNA synthetase beta chain